MEYDANNDIDKLAHELSVFTGILIDGALYITKNQRGKYV